MMTQTPRTRPTMRPRHLRAACAAALLGALCALAAPATAQAAEDGEPTSSQTRTYALIVAHNGSVDEGVAPLRYADDDGARYYETFSHLADEARLLTVLDADSQRVFPEIAPKTQPPTRAKLRAAVAELSASIERDRAAGRRAELYLIFTGHGNIDADGEGYLSLADGRLRRSDLYREVLGELEADYTHLIIDACHAYFMVQSRGGNGGGDWRDDRSGQTLDDEWRAYVRQGLPREATEQLGSTVGVILSTSGTAEVHEWSRLRAGVFSHQLRSGLLGAADVDGDQRVDYLELEAFLAAANAGVTNPHARISVFARPPAQDRQRALVDLRDFRGATTLELPGHMRGRYHVEDARGLRYADLNLDPSQPTRLMLLQGPPARRDYFLRREGDTQARVPVGQDHVDAGALAFRPVTDQARSSVEESFRAELFSTPFGPGFYQGYTASRARYETLLEERTRRPEVAPERAWRLGLDVQYGLSAPSIQDPNLRGLQHNLAVAAPFTHRSGWRLGPYLGYGFSAPELTPPGQDPSRPQIHRLSLGAQLERHVPLGQRLWLAPRARLGHQALLLSDEDVCAQGACLDPIGLRAGAALGLGWRLRPALSMSLEAGLVADVVTRAGLEDNQEALSWSPLVGLGLRF